MQPSSLPLPGDRQVLNIYNTNSLVHWEEREINMREHLVHYFSDEIRSHLISTNRAWDVRRIEAPTLMPAGLMSNAYTNSDVWMQECLSDSELMMVLRPETTSSSYVYMQHILSNHSKTRLPLCVWQAGKSYRREPRSTRKARQTEGVLAARVSVCLLGQILETTITAIASNLFGI